MTAAHTTDAASAKAFSASLDEGVHVLPLRSEAVKGARRRTLQRDAYVREV
jgi:hypothetical protein